MPLFALSQIKNLVQDLRRLAARLRTRIRAWRNAEASSAKNREINQERNLTLVPQIDLDKVLVAYLGNMPVSISTGRNGGTLEMPTGISHTQHFSLVNARIGQFVIQL